MPTSDSPTPGQLEDRNFIERSLAVTIAVALKTQLSLPLKLIAKGDPVTRDTALRDVVAALTTSISNQYEIGKLDANSRLYVTNYVKPRDPFDRPRGRG